MSQPSKKKRRRGRPCAEPSGRFGRLLTARMKEANLTQVELSQRTGIPQPRISDFCRGIHEPRLAQLRALAKALGTTFEMMKAKEP